MADRTRGGTRWRGLVVVGDRLWYRPASGRGRRPGLRFEPEGLVVVEPNEAEQVLRWDDGERPGGRATWSLHAIERGRGNWITFRLTTGPAASSHVRLRSGPFPPADELPALCRYLAASPEARVGLAKPERLRWLVHQLAAGGWRRPEPPQEPLAGERLDLYNLVRSTLDDLGWRRIDERPVAGEPKPSVEDATAAVNAALPDELAAGVSEARIRDEVERHLSVGAWPFDALL